MRKLAALLILSIASAIPALSQSFTTVTASNVLVDNGSGTAVHPPAGSSICFRGVNSQGATITYTPSGGSPVSTPVCQTLSAGGALTGSLQVANAATASPLGLNYTIYVKNGTTTYLTFPIQSVSGALFNFDAFALGGTKSGVGIGFAHIACSYGATWASTTLPPGQNAQYCTTAGAWAGYPPNPYCPANNAYQVPQSGGTPFCLPPVLSGNGAPVALCTNNSIYNQQDATPGSNLWMCVGTSWQNQAGGGGTGTTTINTVPCPLNGSCTIPTGGTTVNVNGSSVSNPNFNATTPAAGSNGKNVTWQVSSSSVSAEVVGDGNAAHYLDGTGSYSTPAGGSSGYTNVNGTASQTTVALLNTLCASGTIYATTPLSIATGGTLSCAVQFSKSGLWTLASGQTLVFAQPFKETDGPNQHFAGTGTWTFAASQNDCYGEWFGAVGAGSGGSDNTAAFQKCHTAASGALTLRLLPLTYRLDGPLAITKSNFNIIGSAVGHTSGSFPSTLISTSTTNNVLTVTSTSWNHFEKFTIQRSVVPAGTASGMAFDTTCGVTVDSVYSDDSIRGFSVLGFASCGLSGFTGDVATWGYAGVTETTGDVYGMYVDASAVSPSLRLKDFTVAQNSISAVSHGFYATGSLIQDFMSWNLETALLSHGIEIVGGGIGSQDVHFYGSILDNCGVDCIAVSGTNSAVAPTVQFVGGWAVTKSGNTGKVVDIENSTGVTVTNMQLGMVSGGTVFYTHNSSAVNVSNNTLVSAYATGIQLDTTTSSTVSGNTQKPTGAADEILLTGSTFNNITGNALAGTSTRGLKFDATSNNNNGSKANTINTASITTPLTDLGTNNNPYGTTSNALTADSTGGAAAGTTYDGSVARTFDFHSFGALAAASGVFTGTPDASGATQFKLPVAAGATTLADGEAKYDSTDKNWHIWLNGADHILAPLATGFVSGNCGQPTKTGNSWTIQDAGGACGVSGGGAAFSAITSGTNTTATLTLGSGSSLDVSGTGTNNATKIGGITITGTPAVGNVPTATSSSAATWQTPAGIFPWTFLQSATYMSATQSTTNTFTFPQALQSSGATAFMIVNGDGAQTFNAPSGWTIDLNYASSFNRLVVLHVASASQTSAVFTTSSNAAIGIYFFEISGTHTFGTSATATGTALTRIPGQSITPSAGAIVFSMCGYLTNSGQPLPTVDTPIDPHWRALWVSPGNTIERPLFGIMSIVPATGSAITPPPINVNPQISFYAGLSDEPYATFAIN